MSRYRITQDGYGCITVEKYKYEWKLSCFGFWEPVKESFINMEDARGWVNRAKTHEKMSQPVIQEEY